jgi:hypothetical protein
MTDLSLHWMRRSRSSDCVLFRDVMELATSMPPGGVEVPELRLFLGASRSVVAVIALLSAAGQNATAQILDDVVSAACGSMVRELSGVWSPGSQRASERSKSNGAL